MARTTINSLGVPAGTIVAADLTYPLTTFSSTGIDDVIFVGLQTDG